jgi:hypothetical protein
VWKGGEEGGLGSRISRAEGEEAGGGIGGDEGASSLLAEDSMFPIDNPTFEADVLLEIVPQRDG